MYRTICRDRMRNRAKKVPHPIPNPALINVYLRDTQPNLVEERLDGKAAVEERRAAAVRALHALWHQWKAEVTREMRAVEAAWRDKAPAADHVLTIEEFEAIRQKAEVAEEVHFRLEVEAAMRVRERWIALGAPNLFDGLLRGFFDRAGRVIFESPNPLTAMRDFWEGKPLRGRRREDNLERNRTITAAVQDRVETGEENEKAIAAVAEALCMPYDTVHKIYYAHCLEERAVRGLRARLNAGQ